MTEHLNSAARLRGFFALWALIVSSVLALHYLLIGPLGVTVEVRNPDGPALGHLIAVLGLGAALVSCTTSRNMLLFCVLLCAGASANIIDLNLFGPVADYIPEAGLLPGARSDLYCNLADVTMFSSLVPLGCFLAQSFRSFALERVTVTISR